MGSNSAPSPRASPTDHRDVFFLPQSHSPEELLAGASPRLRLHMAGMQGPYV